MGGEILIQQEIALKNENKEVMEMNINNIPVMKQFKEIALSDAFSWNGAVFIKINPSQPHYERTTVPKSYEPFNAIAVGVNDDDYRYKFDDDDLVVPAYNLQFKPLIKGSQNYDCDDDNRGGYSYGSGYRRY